MQYAREMTLQYVDVATARALSGTRLVASGVVPSPWSEAAKGLFAIARLPLHVVAKTKDNTADVEAWVSVDNVPVLLHESEPSRTNWAAIVGLAARLAAPGTIVPTDVRARAAMTGLIEMIAGEQGLGWIARLTMIQASVESNGERGFPAPVASFLAKRYGHDATVSVEAIRARATTMLALLRSELGDRSYFAGDAPSALDVYVATFLTPLSDVDETTCPHVSAFGKRGFAAAKAALGDLVPAELWALRRRMFEKHLPWPIQLR
jgi:glutathione S-transferase